MKYSQSIRFKLVFWIVLVFIVGAIVQNLTAYTISSRIVTNQMEQECQQVAEAASGEIDLFLQSRLEQMETITRNDSINGMKQAEATASLQKSMSDYYENLVLVWPNGEGLTDQGKQVTVADRDYFQKAIKGEKVISEPLVSRVSGNKVLPLAIPVYRDSRVVGVLIGVLKSDVTDQLVKEVKVGQTGYALMTNQAGICMVHPDPKQVGKLDLNTLGETMPAAVQAGAAGNSGIAKYQYNGVDKYMAYAPVKHANWILGVTVPVAEITQPARDMFKKLTLLVIVILIIVATILYFLSNRFVEPIKQIVEIIRHLANRDLSQQVENRWDSEYGVIMQTFADINNNWREVIGEIASDAAVINEVSVQLKGSAEQTGSASEQVSASADEIARAAQGQAEDAQKTAQLTQQVVQAMQNMGQDTESISKESINFKVVVDRVTDLMMTQNNKMENTRQSTDRVSQVMSDLNRRTVEIGEIVTLISSIAEQTNLLALNAAIEAARAGEQGRGFAVVAEEVRKLAEESGNASQSISSIISDIQSQVEKAVSEAQSVGQLVQEQGRSMVESISAFKQLETGAMQIDNAIQNMSATFEEILASSDEISRAVESISAVTEESAASAEEATAMTQNQLASVQEIVSLINQLESISGKLKDVTDTFKL